MSEASPDAPPEQQSPWDDCKIAFGIEDEQRVWQLAESHGALLPLGWKLCETDGAGARWVAVFRVENCPTVADGQRVLTALREVGAL
jgi:hypothetical protein